MVTALESSSHRETGGIQNTLSTNGCNPTEHVRPVVQKEGWRSKRKGGGEGTEEEGYKEQVNSDLLRKHGTKFLWKK